MDLNQPQHDADEPIKHLAGGDLLIGADAIRNFLVNLGLPETTDPYYLRRSGWPVGNTNGKSGKLIASKRRLVHYIEKLTCGPEAA